VTKQLSGSYRYIEVAAHVQQLIEARTFLAGQRLPSVRVLSKRLRASPATVFAAYQELEQRGSIAAKPQSGFYVSPTIGALPEPAPPVLSPAPTHVSTAELTRRLMAVGHTPDVLALDDASPSADLVPAPALARNLCRAVRRQPKIAATAIYPPGLVALRRAVAQRAFASGSAVGPDDVLVTNGTTEALHLCLRAVARPGDTIAVESPTYYGALQAIENLGLRVVEIPATPQAGISVPHLERALRKSRIAACYATPSFSNPIGSAMPDAAKQALVAVLARAGVPLIEDDAMGELYFADARPRTAHSFDTRGLVLLCGSVSKALAPGWRIGWAIAPKFRDRLAELQWTTTVAPSTPAQLGVAEFLRSGGYDRHLRALRAAVARTMHGTGAQIAQHFPAETTVTRPRGGLVLWVCVPGVDSLRVHAAALEQGIAIMPGALFSPRPAYRDYLRLSCTRPWTPALERTIATLGRIVAGLPRRR
jgi:DNA-binding transcriptional MocR family regulator